MKLGIFLATSSYAINSDTFRLVPDGYHGTFQNWNVTDLIIENESDEIFASFEKEYTDVITDHETKMFEYRTVNSVKNLQNMILYLQDVPLFGKFFNYGCHCFPGGVDGLYDARERRRPVIHAKPVDQADNVCRNHERCHACIKMDHSTSNFGEHCDIHKGYSFQARQDSVTGSKYIICMNKEGTCQKAKCECDKALAYDLAEYEYLWSLMNHREWSNFDAESRCAIQHKNPNGKANLIESANIRLKSALDGTSEPIQECCGSYPRRYPYHPDDGQGNIRQCCHSTPFDPTMKECCPDGTPRQFGSCP